MTSRALQNQTITPRFFGCLTGRCSHRTMAEADACDERTAATPGFDPGKTLDDWRREVDGEYDEREEES